MPHDPYPTLTQTMRVRTSEEMLGVNLEDPQVWNRPPVTDPDYYLTVHWGGGPNLAGQPIEEPTLSFGEKLQVELGRCKTVLRGWLAYHVNSRNMSTIAYSTWVSPWGGQVGKLRGHRWNGGQWGSINEITHALVLVVGYGQTIHRRAWQTVGLVWFCGGAPRVVPHRFFNDWPQTQTQTSCPGDVNTALIAGEEYIRALGRLRHRPGLSPRGRRVRALTVKLTQLAFLGGRKNRYSREVAAAVAAFQQAYFVTGDRPGQVGANTWKALAEA